MTLFFGLHLDEVFYPEKSLPNGNHFYLGPAGLLRLLESLFGLEGSPEDNNYLRIEAYRQVLRQYLETDSEAFFQHSFEADQFATASDLLDRRDELLLAGWDFSIGENMPVRLKVLAKIETLLKNKNGLDAGFSERFLAVELALQTKSNPFEKIYLVEPLDLLPHHFQRLLEEFSRKGATVAATENDALCFSEGSDLDFLKKNYQSNTGTKKKAQKDGSLVLIRGKRAGDLAPLLAKIIAKNPNFEPCCLVPEKNRILDNAFVQEGVPSLGILSASLARPSLQILKLVTAFFWEPINPYKILEFVSLAVKPFDDELGVIIAKLMAKNPGINGDSWNIEINRFFDSLREKNSKTKRKSFSEIKHQYDFWFERNRYDITSEVPKNEVVEVFLYLENWARVAFENEKSESSSLLVLSQQARRIKELLVTLPESALGFLELERIVRTIYEPSPVTFRPEELGRLPFVYHPAALTGPVDELVWWNFAEKERTTFFSRWYADEVRFLFSKNARIETPELQNQRMLWQQLRPFRMVRKRLWLVIPETVNGKEFKTHPLMADLEATFVDTGDLTVNADSFENSDLLRPAFKLPTLVDISAETLGQPPAFIEVKKSEKLGARAEESFTGLETLLYYPHQWVFRHKIQLSKSAILSVVKDATLMGNLAHRLFESLLRQNFHEWSKSQLESWVENRLKRLLQREGAVLLMYGREPDKIAFFNKMKFAAWSLISAIKSNGWRVLYAEHQMEGNFSNILVKGIADLVLEKDGNFAIVDLKWRGARKWQTKIQNEEDLQLVLYSKLLSSGMAETAYFVLENGRLIARKNTGFKEALSVAPASDLTETTQRIYEKMEATFSWRLEQLQNGRVEVRGKLTWQVLEEFYQDAGLDFFNLLEMKTEDAPYDDYATLINLVE